MKLRRWVGILVLGTFAFTPLSLFADKYDTGGVKTSATSGVKIGADGTVTKQTSSRVSGTKAAGSKATIPIRIGVGASSTTSAQPGRSHAPSAATSWTPGSSPVKADVTAAAKPAEAAAAKQIDNPAVIPLRTAVEAETTVRPEKALSLTEAIDKGKQKTVDDSEIAVRRTEEGITKDSEPVKLLEAEISKLAQMTGLPKEEIEDIIKEAQLVTAGRRQVFNAVKMQQGLKELVASYVRNRPTVDLALKDAAEQLGVGKNEVLSAWIQYHAKNGHAGTFEAGARQFDQLKGKALVGSLIGKAVDGLAYKQFRAEGLSAGAAYRRAMIALNQFALSRKVDPEKLQECLRNAA